MLFMPWERASKSILLLFGIFQATPVTFTSIKKWRLSIILFSKKSGGGEVWDQQIGLVVQKTLVGFSELRLRGCLTMFCKTAFT